MNQVNPAQVQKFLKGVHYPVHKQDLLKTAKEEGADQDVCSLLEKLPEREYGRSTDVSEEIGRLQ